jgi:hypothetical protein
MWASSYAPPAGCQGGERESRENACRYPGRADKSICLSGTYANDRPGAANPNNAVLPFGYFDRLHFARFVILDDVTVSDVEAYGVTHKNLPLLSPARN